MNYYLNTLSTPIKLYVFDDPIKIEVINKEDISYLINCRFYSIIFVSVLVYEMVPATFALKSEAIISLY